MASAAGRVAPLALGILLACGVLPALAACGSGTGQVSVDVSGGSGPYKPGDTPTFMITVTNHGPGDAPGVQVRVDLPGSFHYKTTQRIDGRGNARTQPLDARVGVSSPLWGYWNLAAPNPNASQDQQLSYVAVTFVVDIGGKPDTYTLTGHAQGDNTAGVISGSPLPVQVQPAPKLAVSATVSPVSLRPSSLATYRVTITNSGDGPAKNVSVLLALPPVMGFQQSITPFAGNAARESPVDPVKNSVEVFYGGFDLPANSVAGPGFITIVFKAAVVPRAAKGTYTISIQLTDNDHDQVLLLNAAPVSINGVPVASPSSSPSPGG